MSKTDIMALGLAAILISCAALVGCGGGSASSPLAILADSSGSMSDVRSYRMRGSTTMDMEGPEAEAAGFPLDMEMEGEVQLSGGEMRMHMVLDLQGQKMESYIVDGRYYQQTPRYGWVSMDLGLYKTSNPSIGPMDPREMELMSRLGRDPEVFEEDDETIGISLRLDREFLEGSIEMAREYYEEAGQPYEQEAIDEALEGITGFQAEIKVWISKESGFLQELEAEYVVEGVSPAGAVTSSMHIEFYDYDGELEIELPEEAGNANELESPAA